MSITIEYTPRTEIKYTTLQHNSKYRRVKKCDFIMNSLYYSRNHELYSNDIFDLSQICNEIVFNYFADLIDGKSISVEVKYLDEMKDLLKKLHCTKYLEQVVKKEASARRNYEFNQRKTRKSLTTLKQSKPTSDSSETESAGRREQEEEEENSSDAVEIVGVSKAPVIVKLPNGTLVNCDISLDANLDSLKKEIRKKYVGDLTNVDYYSNGRKIKSHINLRANRIFPRSIIQILPTKSEQPTIQPRSTNPTATTNQSANKQGINKDSGLLIEIAQRFLNSTVQQLADSRPNDPQPSENRTPAAGRATVRSTVPRLSPLSPLVHPDYLQANRTSTAARNTREAAPRTDQAAPGEKFVLWAMTNPQVMIELPNSNYLVKDVKKIICQKLSIPVNLTKIYCGNRPLNEELSVKDNKLQQNDKLSLKFNV